MRNEDWKWGGRKGERFRLTRILSRESYREMFSQKMFRRKNITLDFFCSDEEDSLFFFFTFFKSCRFFF